jgi:hypothetical protein
MKAPLTKPKKICERVVTAWSAFQAVDRVPSGKAVHDDQRVGASRSHSHASLSPTLTLPVSLGGEQAQNSLSIVGSDGAATHTHSRHYFNWVLCQSLPRPLANGNRCRQRRRRAAFFTSQMSISWPF